VIGHEGDVRVFTCVGHCLVQGDVVEAQRLLALAGNIFIGDGFVVQEIKGDLIEVMGPFGWIDEIGCQHGVEHDTLETNSMTGEYHPVVFYILSDFFYGRVCKNRFQPFDDIRKGHLFGRPQVAVATGYVETLIRFDGKGKTHQIGAHGICGGGFRIHRDQIGFDEGVDECVQLIRGQHRQITLVAQIRFSWKELLQLSEFQLGKEFGEFGFVRGSDFKFRQIEIQGCIRIDGHQGLA